MHTTLHQIHSTFKLKLVTLASFNLYIVISTFEESQTISLLSLLTILQHITLVLAFDCISIFTILSSQGGHFQILPPNMQKIIEFRIVLEAIFLKIFKIRLGVKIMGKKHFN